MTPQSFSVNGYDLVLYSEYAFDNLRELQELSLSNPNKIIISGLVGKHSVSCVILKNGIVKWNRDKFRYTSGEKLQGCRDSTNSIIYEANIDGLRILPIMCYEICFPELTMSNAMPDVVVHLIGFPMFDKNQKTPWVALEKTLGKFYDCPVYACTGGEGDMRIMGKIHERNTEKGIRVR